MEIILGARQTPYGITYLVGWSDGFEPKTYPCTEAHEKFPKLVIKFLEDNIEFVRGTDGNQKIVVSQQQVGNPIEIICKFSRFWTFFPIFNIIFFKQMLLMWVGHFTTYAAGRMVVSSSFRALRCNSIGQTSFLIIWSHIWLLTKLMTSRYDSVNFSSDISFKRISENIKCTFALTKWIKKTE